VKLLLDTHAFLYAIGEPERLPATVRALLAEPGVERYISVVSLWEIAVKIQIGKLPLPPEPAFYQEHSRALQATFLPVGPRHTFELFQLPMLHRDPFDRLLAAQARVDGLTIVTRDAAVAAYDVVTVW